MRAKTAGRGEHDKRSRRQHPQAVSFVWGPASGAAEADGRQLTSAFGLPAVEVRCLPALSPANHETASATRQGG